MSYNYIAENLTRLFIRHVEYAFSDTLKLGNFMWLVYLFIYLFMYLDLNIIVYVKLGQF